MRKFFWIFLLFCVSPPLVLGQSAEPADCPHPNGNQVSSEVVLLLNDWQGASITCKVNLES